MAFMRFAGANQPVDLSIPSFAQFATALETGATSWNWHSSGRDFVQLTGSGLRYDAEGRAVDGVITEALIDIGANGRLSADILISGMSASAAFMDDARDFWDEALGGNDVINVQGLDADRVGADGHSVIFGDDLFARLSKNASAITDSGGNDVFITGDGSYTLIGDVHRVEGIANAGVHAFYDAGDDLITGAITAHAQAFVGDAFSVGANGRLLGGNDTLSSASSSPKSTVVGDVLTAAGASETAMAVVMGGDDLITGLNPVQAEGSRALLVGDVARVFSFAEITGGRDRIAGSDQAEEITGDVRIDLSANGTHIRGGNDVLLGGGGNDTMTGDVRFTDGNARIEGGRDVMRGGAGDDLMFGEVGSADESALANVRGGNDRMFGGQGNDRMFGQTGRDMLDGGAGADFLSGGQGADTLLGGAGRDVLDGGLGPDVLTGGAGADTFLFTTRLVANNVDVITDFETGRDAIGLDTAIFRAIGTGALDPGAFHMGPAAADADDRIVYDPESGALYYDRDGSGKAAAIQFATLDAGLALTSADFFGLSA